MASEEVTGGAPLIVFVHVPKAGGSTINWHLRQTFPNGLEHCEHFIQREDELARRLAGLDWVSGHVTYRRLRKIVGRVTQRPLRMFTCVREPLDHVASHYNWVVRLRENAPLAYLRYPKEVREMSARLRRSDNSDPNVVIENLRAYSRFFLNVQTRYVFGGNRNLAPPSIREGLGWFEGIASSRNLDTLVSRMTGHLPDTGRKENVSPYRVDSAVFQSPSLRRFLEEANARDIELFAGVRAFETETRDTAGT